MARTSKREKKRQSAKSAIAVMEPVWKAGIYARLSVDNNDRKNESIDTQIEIAKEYIGRTGDTELIECYVDLGKTGTNFNREGFEHMMEDIRRRRINCVVVKDFSRFGRNYIETGNYIEKIFPYMKVRFIAVTDGYDSEHLTDDHLQLSMNLKNIVNELYAKDIAQKVGAAMKVRQEMGSYTGGVPPYGYCIKKIRDRNVLVPDMGTKEIVVGIFEMFAAGSTYKEIAEDLYKRKIQRPMAYYATGETYCLEDEKLQQWSYHTMKNILTNPVYIGTLFQARTCGKAYRDRKRHDVDEEKDISVVECTHEPLVSEELFYKVSERFERQSKYSNQKGFSKRVLQSEDIFKDMVSCGRCGGRMIRNPSIKTLVSGDRIRRYYYACPNKKKIDGSQCCGQGISFLTLESLIKAVLEKEFACSDMQLKDFCKENTQEAEKRKSAVHKKICKSVREQDELALMGSKLYLRYRDGELLREDFLEEKAKLSEMLAILRKQTEDLKRQEITIDRETGQTNQFIRGLLKWRTDYKFDRKLAECLIKKINVYPKHQVEIVLNYRRNELLYGRKAHE
ncbi:MAG: recombinase family protein [Lachnospiraceae bacterium]|nr:recombinase family protein [Lachnospiraceae bacterium]